MSRWTSQDIQNRLASNKALSVGGMAPSKGEGEKVAGRAAKSTQGRDAGKENKAWMYQTLKTWCEERGYLLIREHTFSDLKGWRLDWAVFDGTRKVLACEYEGIMSQKSRHTTKAGFTEDANKYTAAALEGWKVLRYTAANFHQLETDLTKIEI